MSYPRAIARRFACHSSQICVPSLGFLRAIPRQRRLKPAGNKAVQASPLGSLRYFRSLLVGEENREFCVDGTQGQDRTTDTG